MKTSRRVLNAHQGCCETRPDFGMPDLTNAIGQGADAVRAIAHSLTQQIEMFEPRLRNVSIRFQTDRRNPLQLTFHVGAMLDYNGRTEPVTFDAIYEERVRVKG
ncbi:type VI secretion system protein [Bradyrhizobium sp. LB7.1]